MSDAFTTPTRKAKNVRKMRRELCKKTNDKHKTKNKYAEGFTPPDPSSEESASEASMHGQFKTEEDQSDDEGHMELDDDLSVRYVDETLRHAYFHPYFTLLYYVVLH